MYNGSTPAGPATLILIDIREDAIYARIGGLLASNPGLASITASQVTETDIQSASATVATDACIAHFEEKVEDQIAFAAIRLAAERFRKTDHD